MEGSTQAVARHNGGEVALPTSAEVVERLIATGDLSKMTPRERNGYYVRLCESVGLNPLSRPFEYLVFQGKMTLYARKECAEQLRQTRNVSCRVLSREIHDGIFVVTAGATVNGREDESIGAVSIEGLKGEARANAMMKAETKAKRRVTLSICGLGFMDESEAETVPGAQRVKVNYDTGKIIEEAKPANGKPAPASKPQTNGVTPVVGNRAVPEDLQGIFAGMKTQQHVTHAYQIMERELVRAGGAEGVKVYNAVLTKHNALIPEGGKQTVRQIKECLLDMWEAKLFFEQAPPAVDEDAEVTA